MTQPPQYAQKYKVKGNGLYEILPGKSGTIERKLCNLAPEIVCEVTLDDGAVTTTYVRLRGVHESGRPLPEIEIPAADLASFNWMAERWGMDCILEVGKTVKDCVLHAIQTTAAHAEKKRPRGAPEAHRSGAERFQYGSRPRPCHWRRHGAKPGRRTGGPGRAGFQRISGAGGGRGGIRLAAKDVNTGQAEGPAPISFKCITNPRFEENIGKEKKRRTAFGSKGRS